MHNFSIIGERINPGFRSSLVLFENEDLPGIQALAVKQAEAGAACLNVNIGNRAVSDSAFMREVVRAIQDVVSTPLSFDFPRLDVQQLCLQAYDPSRAGGGKPIINSVAESRMDMLEALSIQPSRIVVMASERLENGEMLPNTQAHEVHAVALRFVHLLKSEYALTNDDIIIDVSLSTFAADNRGLTKMALDGMAMISSDPELAGTHIMGGLTNIGLMLPKKEVDGVKLQNAIERSFLMLACPLGFDTVLATPWHDLDPLPDSHPVFVAFRELIELQGVDFLRGLRAFLRACS